MESEKLRIGILLDAYEIPAWIYHSIEQIHHSDYAEFSLIILNKEVKVVNKNKGRRKNENPIVYRLFNRFDERLFIRGHNALESKNAEELLTGVPVIKVRPEEKGMESHFEARDIDEIHHFTLDVLIKIGFDSLCGDILTASKHGVWAYQFPNSPHGFWEVIKSDPETKEYLLILNENPADYKIIYGSSSNTYLYSPA